MYEEYKENQVFIGMQFASMDDIYSVLQQACESTNFARSMIKKQLHRYDVNLLVVERMAAVVSCLFIGRLFIIIIIPLYFKINLSPITHTLFEFLLPYSRRF